MLRRHGARGLCNDGRAAVLSRKCGRHLAAAGITDAEEQYPKWVSGILGCLPDTPNRPVGNRYPVHQDGGAYTISITMIPVPDAIPTGVTLP